MTNGINIYNLHLRFSKEIAAQQLHQNMGSDYSDSDYQYAPDPSDDMDVGEFDSQHRLVGGKIEKYFQINIILFKPVYYRPRAWLALLIIAIENSKGAVQSFSCGGTLLNKRFFANRD